MTVRIVRIGNSRGIRLPKDLLRLYGLEEGSLLEVESRREGILVRTKQDSTSKLPWDVAYQEMAAEAAESAEWAEWDAAAGDGLED